ncbi:hypothetical protein NE848_05230 [Gramella jeungdoensis]|uniref:Uncharacterized protein n=1 Tax=Gramella jeungdoensis TaxID=708091 RepID=A0ABT0Z1U5_9FLAO|nr:hypothetical protein [Gramella jeungdoensis]MCM8568769.1 hypothetical protein [Gramella jeungdoensis]
MFFKVGIKIVFVVTEIFLGFYSLLISDSLLLKFIFFAVTAAIIAFGMLKTLNKVLPNNRDNFQLDKEEEI